LPFPGICRRLRPAPPFGHELVELGLVLGEAQPVQESAELFLLFLQPAEGFRAVLVKRAIAAGRRRRPR